MKNIRLYANYSGSDIGKRNFGKINDGGIKK